MLRNALRPVFSRLRAFWGTLIIKRAQPSLFPCEPDGKLGALAQKRGFAFFVFVWSDRKLLTAPRGEARGYLPTVTLSGAANRM